MLIQLLPEQVGKYWDQVRYGIESALPPIVAREVNMSNILKALLSGEMQAWAVVDKESRKIVGIMTTTLQLEVCSGSRNLLIYSVYALENVGRDNWKEGFETIKRFAQGKGCRKIVAYTAVDAIKKLAKWYGGDTSFTFISIDV